jgi:hypothetical protein
MKAIWNGAVLAESEDISKTSAGGFWLKAR